MKVIAELPEATLQLSVPRPRAHVYDVLENQPSGPKRCRVLDDVHRRGAAQLVSGRRTLRTGVVPAFRRCEQDGDRAHMGLEHTHLNVFQTAGHHVNAGEVGRERRRGGRAHVNASNHVDAGGARSGTAATRSTENVTSAYHLSPTRLSLYGPQAGGSAGVPPRQSGCESRTPR